MLSVARFKLDEQELTARLQNSTHLPEGAHRLIEMVERVHGYGSVKLSRAEPITKILGSTPPAPGASAAALKGTVRIGYGERIAIHALGFAPEIAPGQNDRRPTRAAADVNHTASRDNVLPKERGNDAIGGVHVWTRADSNR